MKYFSLFLFLAAFGATAMGQQQWQLRLGGGYDFSAASQYMLTQTNGNATSTNYRSVNSSFGRGLGFNADITCWINRYFGFTAGGAWHNTLPEVKGHSNFSGFEYGSEEDNNWRSSTVVATAGITLKVPDTKLNPYARMSMLLPVYTRVTNDADWKDYSMFNNSSGTSQHVYRLRNTVGYNAALGIAPALSKHTAVFAEINIQSLAILARHSTMTSYKQNGVEQIDSYSVYSRETDYVKKMDTSYPYNADAPNRQLTFSFPYSSIGIHIGVSFKL